MTALSVGQIQGLSPTNEITLRSNSKLVINGSLRVSTIKNSSDTLTTLSSTSAGNVTLPSNFYLDGNLTASVLSPTRFKNNVWNSSTIPTSSLSVGTMGFNSSTNKLDVYGPSGWGSGGTGTLSTSGLFLLLDATSSSSYPGTGSVWFDISGNGRNFNIVPTAFNSTGKFMDFKGSYGCAKNSSDLTLSGDVTYVTVTRINNTSSGWRTLTRSYVADHHVIVQDGGWLIGTYDNDSNTFISSGYSQQSLPGYASNSFMVMIWRWTNSDNPTYSLSVNGVTVGNIVNSNARYDRGFGCIGGTTSITNNTDPSVATQFWGDIKLFAVYNRRLSDYEVLTTYNALKSYL